MQQSMRVPTQVVRMYLCVHVHICATASCASTYVTYPCVHAHVCESTCSGLSTCMYVHFYGPVHLCPSICVHPHHMRSYTTTCTYMDACASPHLNPHTCVCMCLCEHVRALHMCSQTTFCARTYSYRYMWTVHVCHAPPCVCTCVRMCTFASTYPHLYAYICALVYVPLHDT